MNKKSSIFSPVGTEVNIIPVMQGEPMQKVDTSELPTVLPILALRNAIVFPGTVFPVTVGREKSITLIREVEKSDGLLGAVPQTDVQIEDPGEADLFHFGTACRIIKTLEMPDGSITAILQGLSRIEIKKVIRLEPYLSAYIKYLEDYLPDVPANELKMLTETLKDKASGVIRGSSFAPKEAVGALRQIDDFEFLVNFVATSIEVEDFQRKSTLLETGNVKDRGMALLSLLDNQLELIKIKQEINQTVRSDIDQQQREYFLNNQLRTIQEELGMDSDEDLRKFRERAAAKKWPEEVKGIFEKEMARLEKYNPSSPDYSIQYNYIQFMLDLPWGEFSEDNMDLQNAKKVLDIS